MVSKEIEILITLMNEKLKLLVEILELTNMQTKVIQEEKIDKLSNLINSKQLRIDKIDVIDNKFQKQFNGIKKQYNIEEIWQLDVEKDCLVKLKEVTEKVYRIMKDIYEIEKKNNQMINKSFEMAKTKLREIKKGKQITSNYYKKSTQFSGYFIDKKK